MKPAMEAILLIADNNVRRRGELRRFFWDSGFLVAEAADGLKCLAELLTLEPHVLVIALEIPPGGGAEVILQLNDGLAISRKPLILVIGNATVETLSARTGVAPCNCFPTPFREDDLLERIATELAAGLPRDGEDRLRPSAQYERPTLV
jgi:CheY-like chemotaxis protein